MAQLKFYFTDSERKELFAYLQKKKSKLIPDIHFNSEKCIVISDFSEFADFQQNETVHFFLTSEKFSIQPLIVSQNKLIADSKYYVTQRKGGPYIDLSFYRYYAKDSQIPYKLSVIEYYTRFIHADRNTEFRASDELKKYYKDITRYITRKCKTVMIGSEKYLIGNGVIREIAPVAKKVSRKSSGAVAVG